MLKAYDRLTFAENEIKAIKDARSKEAAKQAMEAAQRAREAERKARMAAENEAAEREAAERKARMAAEKEAAKKKKSTRRGSREILPDPYKIDVSSQNITGETAEEKESEKTVPPPPPASASSYDRGMTLFKQKKFREAYNSFAESLDKNSTGPQAINARYYAAQSLYEDKDYEKWKQDQVHHNRGARLKKGTTGATYSTEAGAKNVVKTAFRINSHSVSTRRLPDPRAGSDRSRWA